MKYCTFFSFKCAIKCLERCVYICGRKFVHWTVANAEAGRERKQKNISNPSPSRASVYMTAKICSGASRSHFLANVGSPWMLRTHTQEMVIRWSKPGIVEITGMTPPKASTTSMMMLQLRHKIVSISVGNEKCQPAIYSSRQVSIVV